MSDSEFGKTNRLRSDVKGDQAGRSRHGVKGLNRNSKIQKQNFNSERKFDEMHFPQHLANMCDSAARYWHRPSCNTSSSELQRMPAMAGKLCNGQAFKPIHLFAPPVCTPPQPYLENGYARIFGELPFQFSNEAPAVI